MAAVIVETTHSLYHFDTDAMRFSRHRRHAEASRLDGDGESQAYEWYEIPPDVGFPMMIGLANGKTRTTTAVIEVR